MRSSKTLARDAMFGCIGVLVMAFANALIVGWILMLLLGAVWHELGWGAPIGFWPATGIGVLVTLIWGWLFKTKG